MCVLVCFFFFKQKTAYEMRISDWSSDVCSSDLHAVPGMIEVVETLYGLGVPLYAITNFSAELWPPFRATQPIFDHFRDILVSGEERLIKPDAEIFHLAARRFGIAPERSLFIDEIGRASCRERVCQ